MRYTKINLKLKRTNFARAPPRFASIRRVEGERRKEWGWANEGRGKEEGGTMEGERAATRDWAALAPASVTNERNEVDITDVIVIYFKTNISCSSYFSFLFSFFFLLSLFSYTYTNIAKYLLLFYKNITVSVVRTHTHVRYMSKSLARRESSSFFDFVRKIRFARR